MKPIYSTSIIALLIFFSFPFFKGCGNSNRSEIPNSSIEINILKSVISDLNKTNDSLKKESIKKDTTRVVYLIKWKYLKVHIDSIPCDSALPMIVNLCDTIIMHDSSQIMTLKSIIKLDSQIISVKDHIIKNDSMYIISIHKSIQKHLHKKRWLIDGRCRCFTKEIMK